MEEFAKRFRYLENPSAKIADVDVSRFLVFDKQQLRKQERRKAEEEIDAHPTI